MRTIEEMVHQEVYYNVSVLISDLQKYEPDEFIAQFLKYDDSPYAVEVFLLNDPNHGIKPDEWAEMGLDEREALAYDNGFDPDPIEFYEYWIVSEWLAHKLNEHLAELVVFDYHGLTIWGRGTTGQAIFLDGVIQEIHREVTNAA